MKVFIFYVFFLNIMLFADTIDNAKQLSYLGSLHYINRDFSDSVKKFDKSLEIRRKLGKIDKHYVNILKLFILAKYRNGDFCSLSITDEDRLLLVGDGDLEFLHEYGMIKSGCSVF